MKINKKSLEFDYKRAFIMDGVMVLYCIYLCFDCMRKGDPSTAGLALFDAVGTSLMMPLWFMAHIGKIPIEKKWAKVLMHIVCLFQCCIYWITFAYFLYTGSMGGTSIFLYFLGAPVGFYFFNMIYGLIFCSVIVIGLIVYMWTPLHLIGYSFPEMYYQRLPIMFFLEVIVCALAQYEILKAQNKQEEAISAAENANRAKTDFLSNMSHEIRTPINAILGMNEMIIRESMKAEEDAVKAGDGVSETFSDISKNAHNIESAGNNLLSLINDILDFSKIEAGKFEIVKAEYKLSSLLNDVSNMVFYRAKDKGLEFIADIDGTLPDGLYGDELRVRQIFTNILTNAVKYTNEGSVTLSVKRAGGDIPEKAGIINLEISVTDTGIGIKSEDAEKLFSKFQRVDLEKNSTIEGTGLGLAITRNLLDIMGGTVSVESEYGKGSTFRIILPQQIISSEPVGNFREKFEKSMLDAEVYEESFDAPNAHILIVDDTRMNLMVATGLLKNTRINMDTAESGSEAVEKASSEKYDIILMDQRMPGMDGTEAMNRIRALSGSPNLKTPFICLTADAVSGARERYISEGFTDYLTKPIDYKALENMLMKYLPAGKVERKKIADRKKEVSIDPDNASANDFGPLSEIGIDVSAGISFCQSDTDFYRSVLLEYLQSSAQKRESITKYYEEKNWHDYGIFVHALKSTSKMIGAAELSLEAQAMEKAAKSDDEETIIKGHDKMMEDYAAVIEAIKTLGLEDSSEQNNASGDEGNPSDDVLEFMPE